MGVGIEAMARRPSSSSTAAPRTTPAGGRRLRGLQRAGQHGLGQRRPVVGRPASAQTIRIGRSSPALRRASQQRCAARPPPAMTTPRSCGHREPRSAARGRLRPTRSLRPPSWKRMPPWRRSSSRPVRGPDSSAALARTSASSADGATAVAPTRPVQAGARSPGRSGGGPAASGAAPHAAVDARGGHAAADQREARLRRARSAGGRPRPRRAGPRRRTRRRAGRRRSRRRTLVVPEQQRGGVRGQALARAAGVQPQSRGSTDDAASSSTSTAATALRIGRGGTPGGRRRARRPAAGPRRAIERS